MEAIGTGLVLKLVLTFVLLEHEIVLHQPNGYYFKGRLFRLNHVS